MPTDEAKKNLFEINFKGVNLSPNVNFDKLINDTKG